MLQVRGGQVRPRGPNPPPCRSARHTPGLRYRVFKKKHQNFFSLEKQEPFLGNPVAEIKGVLNSVLGRILEIIPMGDHAAGMAV